MFNPDKPITKEKDEKLNRLNFIKNLSFAINHYDNKECLVIGLLGEWGSGKTSILNLAMNQINENREIFRYNPWIFSEENDLILNFFIELLEIIKKIESKNENDHELVETTKELSENITQYLKKFFNKSTISGNITLLHGISIGGSFTPNWEEKSLEESLGDLKEKINQGLKILDKKIIIIIDDIDRLSDNEVKQIFKLVKTVADFKNTIYILSFDKNMILNSLNKVQSYSSEKYLEKIIPIQIEVPEIDRTKLQKYFEDELIETLTTNEIESIDLKRNSQKDELNKLLNNLTILSNKINNNLLEFDKQINLDEKKDILNELNKQLIQFEKLFKLVQNQYIMSSEEIKKLHITKFKKFFRIYKTHSENIVQKRNLYNILKRGLAVSKKDDINIDLGEENAHLLDISKLDTFMNNAKIITKKTDIFIQELEEELKKRSIINSDEPGYKNYLLFQRARERMIRQNNLNNLKYMLIAITLIIIILVILYYVIANRIDDFLVF